LIKTDCVVVERFTVPSA